MKRLLALASFSAMLLAFPSAGLAAGSVSGTPGGVTVRTTTGAFPVEKSVTFTNRTGMYVMFGPSPYGDYSATGTGWDVNYGDSTCYPYALYSPGDTCVISPRFSPQPSGGRYTGTLTVDYTTHGCGYDPDNSCPTLSTGTATVPLTAIQR